MSTSPLLNALWAVSISTELVLLAFIVVRRNYRAVPAFSVYMLFVLGQNFLFLVYRKFGFLSRESYLSYWIAQGIVLSVRAAVVAEMCRRALGRFRGIWALSWRILLTIASLVVLYSFAASDKRLGIVVSNAQRSLELAIAAALVALLQFARYYEVEIDLPDRLLVFGLCFYSCIVVVNNTILERLLGSYVSLWNLMGLVAFLASMLLWTWAVRKPLPSALGTETMLSSDVYWAVMPEMNMRLRSLNEHLTEFFMVSGRR
jgi:hypothetical protein